MGGKSVQKLAVRMIMARNGRVVHGRVGLEDMVAGAG